MSISRAGPPAAVTAGNAGRHWSLGSGVKGQLSAGELTLQGPEVNPQVRMMRRPAGRFLTMPFPPLPFAARLLAAVILPPRLFFAMFIRATRGYFALALIPFQLRVSPRNRFWDLGGVRTVVQGSSRAERCKALP